MSPENLIKISWIPLPEYFDDWVFLGNNKAYRIAEQIGSIDYLMDIKERLPNYVSIQKFHERVILISLGALFEYGLKHAAYIRLEKEKDEHKITSTLNTEKEERKMTQEGMEGTINRLSQAGLLDNDWFDFLHKVRVLRDEVHMDRNRDENIQAWLDEIGIMGIQNKIEDFRNLLRQIVNV